MSVRSRAAVLDAPAVPVAKVFGPGVPAAMEAAEARSQMTPASPFGPGMPIGPYDGFDRTPRATPFTTGYNIATRPRTHERVSFETIKGLIGAYDIAQICIHHRIDSIRSLDWTLVAADDFDGDATEYIATGMKALDKPDRVHYFDVWLGKWLWDELAYGCGPLSRLRNRAGRCIGLLPVDCVTIAPLLDYWGLPPGAMEQGTIPDADLPPSHVQYVNGIPWNWLTRADLIYEPFRLHNDSPYGQAPVESVILNANTDLRFQVYFLQRFTDGNLPAAFASAPETWTPDQIGQFQAYWDGLMYGDQARKHQIHWMPGGSKFAWSNEKEFTDPFSLFLMRKTCLDEDSEILTRRGWVSFPKLIEGDEVATRSEDGRFEWQKPTDYIAEPYSGDMVQFKSNSLDLLVTPEHRMLLTYFPTKKHPHPKEFIKTAGEIVGKGGYMIPMRSRWEGETPENFVLPGLSYDVRDKGGETFHTVVRPDVVIPMKTWIAFLGLWLAEGHVQGSKGSARLQPGNRKHAPTRTYKVGISQSPDSPYYGEIQELLDSLPFNWSRGNGHTWTCQDMRLHAYLEPLGNSYNKYIPDEAKDLSPELLEILWAWACKGDGHHYLGKSWHMITASERLAGDWQEVLQKCGRDASVSWRKPNDGGVIRGRQITNCKETWIVRERTSPLRTAHGKVTPYEGMVYCVTVPNGVIYVRRNGRPAWVGNCASFHVVPTDIGFTENSNYSTGESQADVAHKTGDLPFARYIQRILTGFLRDDLRLPVKFAFDLGEEQADRADQANADKIYVEMGAISASKIGEMRYGIADPVTIPRFIMTSRGGPVPVSSLMAVAGEIDSATGLPAAGAPLPKDVFGGAEGVLPVPPITVTPLAERLYGPSAMPPSPPPQPQLQVSGKVGPVAKEGQSAPAAGITAATGLYSYDLQGQNDDEDEPEGAPRADVKKELNDFRSHKRRQFQRGTWRDFTFRAVPPVRGHNLNDAGRLAVRKAAGEIAVAGLAVLAQDTGRVLMIQRANDPSDPAAGKLEVPGGHLEGDESPLRAAWREFSEETGTPAPPGVQTGEWTAGDGIYRGIVWTTESEADVPVRGGAVIPNPDDPDSDAVEAIMWVDPADLPGNPMVRDELAASLPDVLPLLGCPPDSPAEGDETTCPCGTSVVYDEANGWQHADGSVSHDEGQSVSDKMTAVAKAYPDGQSFTSHAFRPTAGYPNVCHYCGTGESDPWHDAYRAVAKAGDAAPKALSAPEDWPGWQRDLTLAGIYAGQLRDSLRDAVDVRQLAEDWARANPPAGDVVKSLPPSVAAFLAAFRQAIEAALRKVLPGAWAEGWVLGQQSAQASATAAAAASPREASAALQAVDWAGWQPGDVEAAYQVAGAGLRDLLADQDVQIKSIASSRLEELGDVLAAHLSSPETGGDVTYSVDSLADSLGDVLDDPSMADMVARTEIARAQSAAASWVFRQMGVQDVRISTAGDARVCNACLTAEKDGPQPIGTYTVPLHPMCRCSAVAASPPLTSLAEAAGALFLDGS